MPRFSDVFTYDHFDMVDPNKMVFSECHLLKAVGPHQPETRFDSITFDISGMFLFFVAHKLGENPKVNGPYPLSTR